MQDEIDEISLYTYLDLERYFMKADISFLHSLKLYLDDKYYNTGDDTGFSDEQYDLLKEILLVRDPYYKFPVGATVKINYKKVSLPFWLGSMNKLKPDDESELKRWLVKNKSDEFIVEDKLDGVSCLLTIINGKINIYTRGDGYVGTDITHLYRYIQNIPDIHAIEDLVIRGELIMNYDTFQSKYASDFANPRNFVSGRIGSKTVREGLDDIELVAYEIVKKGVLIKPEDQLLLLRDLGFTVVNYTITKDVTKEVLIEKLLLSKQISPYEIDGIIVQPNVPYVRNSSGNPSYAFAFKVRLDTNLVEATVQEIEWNISKWGLIKPRIRITPINLNGVTITYTSGFNAKYIYDNNIGPDTVIKITRSGDVIPFVVEVVNSTYAQMPAVPYKWNETKVEIISTENDNISCIKLISSFFAALKIKHVSEATVTKMYEYGFDNIIKILSADKTDFEHIQGFGKRLSERTYDNIHNGLQNVSLSLILGASGVLGMGIGTKKVETLLSAIPNLLVIYKDMTRDDLFTMINSVEGFSEKTTTKIIDNLSWADKFIASIKPYISLKINKNVNNDMENQKIVFSGFRDKHLEEQIKQRGGKVVTSVSKNTTILVVSDKDSSSTKIQKAAEFNIDIYTKDEFIQNYNL